MVNNVVRFECMECDFAVESSDQDEVVTLAQMHAIVKHANQMKEQSKENALKS